MQYFFKFSTPYLKYISNFPKSLTKVHFVDTLSRQTYFWDTAVPCGSENSHNVVQLNPDEDKYYLLTPFPTLLQPLKKFSPESIRAIARNPNIDLQSLGIYIINLIYNITLEHNIFRNY